MQPKIDWEDQIGHRLTLRDLHVFLAAVQRGNILRASEHLGVPHRTVSVAIANLERELGVPLLDRTTHGVTPTIYGQAMIERSRAAFDELKQGVTAIEELADPTAGAVRIGCDNSHATTILPPVVERFYQKYPRAQVHMQDVIVTVLDLPALRDRSVDFILARRGQPDLYDASLNLEFLFNDDMVITVAEGSPWANRREVDIAELIHEPWILTQPGSWNYSIVAEAFRARGLEMPKISVTTFSVDFRIDLLMTGRYVTAFPRSVVNVKARQFPLKILPVDLPKRPWPVEIITLKHRTLSPVVEHFIEYLREFCRTMKASSPPL